MIADLHCDIVSSYGLFVSVFYNSQIQEITQISNNARMDRLEESQNEMLLAIIMKEFLLRRVTCNNSDHKIRKQREDSYLGICIIHR